MGIRQSLNEKPLLSAILTGIVIAAAIGFIIWQSLGGHRKNPHGSLKAFYSDDDGKTYFVADGNKLTPFTDENGRQAVQAVVYQCREGEPFVAYLMRHSDEGRKLAAAPPAPANSRINAMTIMEVKKPAAKEWVKFDPKNAKAYTDVMTPTCPNGGNDGLHPVFP